MSDTVEDLQDRIRGTYGTLSAAMQRVAKVALDDPLEISLQPLRTIAGRTGVGPTTLVRFAKVCGFSSYSSFREFFRSGLRQQSTSFSERGRALLASSETEDALLKLRDTLKVGLDDTFGRNSNAALEAFAAILGQARMIYVVGLRSAFAPAFYLHYLLSLIRQNVSLIENRVGMLPEELRHAGPGDVAVAISFDPYTRATINAAQQLRDSGATILSISDSLTSPLVPLSAQMLQVSTSSPSYYVTLTPLTAMIELIAAATALQVGVQGVATLRAGDNVRTRPGNYWSSSGKAS